MKKSELLNKQTTLRSELEVLRNATVAEDRLLTEDEQTQFTEIERSLTAIDSNLSLIRKADEQAALSQVTAPVTMSTQGPKVIGNLQAVRSLVDQGTRSDTVMERNADLAGGVSTGGVFVSATPTLISRAGEYSMATDAANISNNVVKGMNIIEGRTDLYKSMGVTMYNDLQGSTATLPFMDPFVGLSVDEKDALVKEEVATNSVTLTPRRSGVQIQVTREALAGFSEAAWNSILQNAYDVIDRQITTKVYSAIAAGATEVAAAAAINKAGFDALSGACPVDGSFFMPRANFYAAKAVAIDAGSGRFLAERSGQDIGMTYDGFAIWHSAFFASAVDTDYYTYGIPSNIAIGFWGNDAYEVIVDETTNALTGELLITISKVNDLVIPNVARAFYRSVDLDPAP